MRLSTAMIRWITGVELSLASGCGATVIELPLSYEPDQIQQSKRSVMIKDNMKMGQQGINCHLIPQVGD
jgi:hypothetical protein